MIKNIAAAYTVYLAELDAYREWTDGRKAVYGQSSSPIESWTNSDHERVTTWNKELNAMEKVLGLSADEVKVACESVGVSTTPAEGE